MKTASDSDRPQTEPSSSSKSPDTIDVHAEAKAPWTDSLEMRARVKVRPLEAAGRPAQVVVLSEGGRAVATGTVSPLVKAVIADDLLLKQLDARAEQLAVLAAINWRQADQLATQADQLAVHAGQLAAHAVMHQRQAQINDELFGGLRNAGQVLKARDEQAAALQEEMKAMWKRIAEVERSLDEEEDEPEASLGEGARSATSSSPTSWDPEEDESEASEQGVNDLKEQLRVATDKAEFAYNVLCRGLCDVE